ncbi:MAG: ATP-binding cassette domain-containing protein [Firmicutes bacterium]|nr:ATP-binding cassette domain-containing protein [Bacillota bacterium]
MPMLVVEKLARFFGARTILRGVSFQLEAGEKVALVGPNGVGKTTLLRILAGELEPDEGRVLLPQGCRTGYLTQDPVLNSGKTVEEEAWGALGDLGRWEEELRQLETRMSQLGSSASSGQRSGLTVRGQEELDVLLRRYTQVTERFEAGGGYEAPVRLRTVLAGLGFSGQQLNLPSGSLSGGQKVRLGLARVLLQEPDLLLLDEPTNHLDLAAVEWLEEFLSAYRGAVLLVSHDRHFLDRVTGRTLEMEEGRVTIYPGNFSFYQVAKKEREEGAREAWQAQQEEIRRLKDFIARFQAGTRATLAKDRAKKLAHMKVMEKPKGPTRRMALHFTLGKASGQEVLELKELTAAFGAVGLFRLSSLKVRRGERVALIGRNGAGKTTLLKILQGQISPTAGSFCWGHGVKLGYFSQELDQLDPQKTALEEFLAIPGMTPLAARSLLGRFLFGGDEVTRLIGGLSGGERNRLALAKLVLSGANVLLLDEPTNHLDIPSRQVLEEALLSFPGTILLVSHDRFFLDRVATRIWEFANGGITSYLGNYTAYREEKARLLARGAEATHIKGPADSPVKAPKGSWQGDTGGRKKDWQERLSRVEGEIGRLEARKQELLTAFAQPRGLGESIAGLAREYKEVEERLTQLYDTWGELAEWIN